jgi:2-oxo-4-hydroxy-4-carboxy-5-ureidoimidazoline decarboxylase
MDKSSANVDPMAIDAFNVLDDSTARDLLEPCCMSARWIDDVLAARPYRDRHEVIEASDASLEHLEWPDVEEALQAHPPLGEPVEPTSDESAWSKHEQSDSDASPVTMAALREANIEYEKRFGFVFLIFATGRSYEEMLEGLRERLNNTIEIESEIVRQELREIVTLRLTKTFAGTSQ